MLNIIKCKRTKTVLFFGRGCTLFVLIILMPSDTLCNIIISCVWLIIHKLSICLVKIIILDISWQMLIYLKWTNMKVWKLSICPTNLILILTSSDRGCNFFGCFNDVDSFCIESCVLRHKFRVLKPYNSEKLWLLSCNGPGKIYNATTNQKYFVIFLLSSFFFFSLHYISPRTGVVIGFWNFSWEPK